ncbi:hypothetical protein J6500_20185 [Bradyrhizobium sp. WSM 1704]|uniref:hypothetical protein n=1 Tax=Bradyrhizobium semiaridum TaxID=2821404 RepID=UPI001CE36655|nr:hypothetical protein [Bradyrhizobium semiaridum]MCA6124193.1 hypothetical protein [Bradyrhizobium semiaridum]
MMKLVAIATFVLIGGQAFAGETGPLPQAGMERPENTNGATEKGSMDTTGMNVNRANKSEKDKASREQRKNGDAKK